MSNASGFERSIKRNKGGCKRCETAEPMDGSDYCRSCAEFLRSLTA